ncbi:MAG: dihydroorotase [Candidatus Omnitrophica bacterium]|jgi:dihydroorotase|nr:dihydroorotase [Candidatus Omnitrophota bacterium]MDD3987660.1 dihydroorotase [Candidatus Omnitrophota bacterium]MDD4981377.1 dihydroorotase [Candidatus Omnitrophota bacterium]MDD5664763.1 dihydroorotase [Candidatus Omnitrophota bacterium]
MAKEKILIKGGRVIDPANKIDDTLDIFIVNGKISKVSKAIKADDAKVLDASGKIIIPGLVDMHVHLREPGREDKETIYTATKAALHGGVTAVLAMPNTDPAIDSLSSIEILKTAISKSAQADVLICAAITTGRKGREVVDMAMLKKEGAVAFSDDGSSVDSDEIMLAALRSAKKAGLPIICHSEDKALSNFGVVNLGFTSTRLGLKGISQESEYKRVARDVDFAAQSGAAVHIAHVSCKESLGIIARAKKKGLRVTCETAPHYFTFSEDAVLGYDTNFKMNPPLRSKEDVQAIREGLANGIIDVIASDHAPHTENEKEIEFERAEFGVVGLETELSAAITVLVDTGFLDWFGLVEKMSLNPARILGVDKGSLGEGRVADMAIIEPGQKWQVAKDLFLSKSKNSSFIGKDLKGVVAYTIYKGAIHQWSS